MEIRPVERLILIMLSEIHERVGCTGTDAKFVREALYGGHDWAFEWQCPGIFPEPIEDGIATEVCDILDMWRIIEDSSDEKFPGFDTNREGRHAAVASFLTEEMDRFTWFKGRTGHGVVGLDGYRRMLESFLPMRAKLADRNPPNLTKQEADDLLALRRA